MGNLNDKVQSAKGWWNSNTVIGGILFILPVIVRMINPDLTLDVSGGAEEVFAQAGELANQVDSAWVTLSDSLGKILIAFGIRKAAGGTPLKVF